MSDRPRDKDTRNQNLHVNEKSSSEKQRLQSQDEPQFRENYDPSEGDRPWPLPIWIALMLMVSWATTYFALNAGDGKLNGGDQRQLVDQTVTSMTKATSDSEPITLEGQMQLGKKVYNSICSACHQASGLGLTGAFPPLVQSDWVLGDTAILAKLILHGLQGEIQVMGQSYNGVMPAHQDQFDDEQIAAVISYIRNSWGNQGSQALPAEVSSLRAAHKERTGAWTASELRP